MKLDVQKITVKNYELTEEEITILNKATEIINKLAVRMEDINDEEDFEVLLQNKSTGDIFTAYDIMSAKNTIEGIIDGKVEIDDN